MLTLQASFDPPGVSVAVKKDRAVEPLMVLGNKFILNVLAQGKEKARPCLHVVGNPSGPRPVAVHC